MPNSSPEAVKIKSKKSGKFSIAKRVFLIIGIIIYLLILIGYVYFNAVRLMAENKGEDPVYFGSTKIFTTYTTELQPEIVSGSLVFVKEKESYQKPDIIAIRTASKTEVEVAYIVKEVSGTGETGVVAYEANTYLSNMDNIVVAQTDICGAVQNSIANFGRVFTFINGLGGLIAIVIVPFVLFLIWLILKFVRRSADDDVKDLFDDEFSQDLYNENTELTLSKTGSLLYNVTDTPPEIDDIDFNALKQNYQDTQAVPGYEDVLKQMSENIPEDIRDVQDVSELKDAALVDESKEYRSGVLDEFDENTVLYSGNIEDYDEQNPTEEDISMEPDEVNQFDSVQEENGDDVQSFEEGITEEEPENYGIDAYMTDEGLEISVSNLKTDKIRFIVSSDGSGIVVATDDFSAEINVDIKNL